MPRQYLSAQEAFLNLVLFTTLYLAAYALGSWSTDRDAAYYALGHDAAPRLLALIQANKKSFIIP